MKQLGLFLLILGVSGCRCSSSVTQSQASIEVTPTPIAFGAVAVGKNSQLNFQIVDAARGRLELKSVRLEGDGAAQLTLGTTPTGIDGLTSVAVNLVFAPTAVGDLIATLVIDSNDVSSPTLRIPITGEGAVPQFSVTPSAIQFDPEPLHRSVPIDVSKLPTVQVNNIGKVSAKILGLSFTGADATAFSIGTGIAFPSLGVSLEPGTGVSIPIRFVPTSASQMNYVGQLVVETEDVQMGQMTVDLRGSLRDNLPPRVCANVTRVTPEIGSPRDYNATSDWSALLTPPLSGYDFRSSRNIEPRSVVSLSALSTANAADCTTDPEDGRTGLSFLWTVEQWPDGSVIPVLGTPMAATASMKPVSTGEYGVRLQVTDGQSNSTTVHLKLSVSRKEDLVAELQWLGYANVDLDLHLVRPTAVAANSGDPNFGGVFDFFHLGALGQVSGDMNGYAQKKVTVGSPYRFDWGKSGNPDDPQLNVDDMGFGALTENISLNEPQNDDQCAAGSCTYKVYVHYFKDSRPVVGSACVVDGGTGCQDGQPCDCSGSSRCVASSAPANVAPTGAGQCIDAPKPVVKIFIKGSAQPLSVIPLPPDELVLGAPCQMLYVADVTWPGSDAGTLSDGGLNVQVTPRGTTSRFGFRSAGSLECQQDYTESGGVLWFSRQP